MKEINTQIYTGDSWILPRTVWIDVPCVGKKGDKAQIRINSDIGIYVREKGEEIEGVAIPALVNNTADYILGEDGKLQIQLAGSPMQPTPRTGIIFTQISLKPKRKKKFSPSITKVEEKEEIIETLESPVDEVIIDEADLKEAMEDSAKEEAGGPEIPLPEVTGDPMKEIVEENKEIKEIPVGDETEEKEEKMEEDEENKKVRRDISNENESI